MYNYIASGGNCYMKYEVYQRRRARLWPGRPSERELSLMMTAIFSGNPTDEWARDKLTLPTHHGARRTTIRLLQHTPSVVDILNYV
jgi:hypothetical protein